MRPASARSSLALVLLLMSVSTVVRAQEAAAPHTQMPHTQMPHTLMPLPAEVAFGAGSLAIDTSFTVALAGYTEPRLERAAERFARRLARQTGVLKLRGVVADPAAATLVLHTEAGAPEVQRAVEEEGYALTITSEGARLTAPSPYGILRGLQTFLQLVRSGASGFEVPAATITDQPRYPWRGLLVDVARHWLPKEVILRNLDAMEAVKLNVLHLHLSEDQGFRVESRRYPKLHELGSDGDYFTQDDIREIIAYARDRGIRVMPEFDVPGHTTSWFVGYPELASAPGPYTIERHWGIFDPSIDPTKESTYTFFEGFLDEMTALFPDPYFHIGGDEVTGKPWTENEAIQAFIAERGLKDNHGLQAYFNGRLLAMLQERGKKMVGWDEIFHPDLPKDDVVIHSWRGQQSLAEAAKQGYQGILSFGYYIDLQRPAWYHYRIDPLDEVEVLSMDGRPLWGAWELWYQLPEGSTSGSAWLYGTPDDLVGYFQPDVAAAPIVLEGLALADSVLTFTFDAGEYGRGTGRATLSSGSWRGTLDAAGTQIPISGPRTDVPGSKLADLTPEQKALVLGGEGTMWAEYVTAETVDSRIWPRMAAIAERLWSPAEATSDLAGMYRRLSAVDQWLTWTGVNHRTNYPLLLQRIANHHDVGPLKTLVDLVEPVELYNRGRTNGMVYSQATPLNRVIDVARPESETARHFNAMVDDLVAGRADEATRAALRTWLTTWRDNHAALQPVLQDNRLLAPVRPLSVMLAQLGTLGLEAEAALAAGQALPADRRPQHRSLLQRAAQPYDEVVLRIVPGIQRLVEAAYAP